ncbi:hypothetical protein GCM10027516_39790 [Niabella aquatica]
MLIGAILTINRIDNKLFNPALSSLSLFFNNSLDANFGMKEIISILTQKLMRVIAWLTCSSLLLVIAILQKIKVVLIEL